MRRLRWFVPLCAVLLWTGCVPVRQLRKLRVTAPVAVRTYGTAGMDAESEVEHAGDRPLRVERAEAEFFAGGVSLGRMLLREGFGLPAGERTRLRTRWRFDFPDAAAGWVLVRRLECGEYERLEVRIEATVRCGNRLRRIRGGKMPVSEFLNIFGGFAADRTEPERGETLCES